MGHVRTALVRLQTGQVVTVYVTQEACQWRIVVDTTEEVHCDTIRWFPGEGDRVEIDLLPLMPGNSRITPSNVDMTAIT